MNLCWMRMGRSSISKRYQAILWDCDGVLIDSEHLACGASAAFCTEKGYPITTENFIDRFVGMNRFQIYAAIEAETGRKLVEGDDMAAQMFERLKKIFDEKLKACDGIADILAAATVPMAVASGSSAARLDYSLGLTGLKDFFKGHIYTSEELPRGKPSPDIFLHAAQQLGVAPEDCLVVEDGIHGIHAAQAAGMDVVAYLGGSHMTPALMEKVRAQSPLHCFMQMSELTNFLKLRI